MRKKEVEQKVGCIWVDNLIIENKTVKGLKKGINKSSVKSIHLPRNIEVIGTDAFVGCINLESVSGEGVKLIKNYAFFKCSELSSAKFPKLEKVDHFAFEGCTNLKKCNYPKLQDIGNYAFGGSGLEEINIPSVIRIGEGAFYEAYDLTTIASFKSKFDVLKKPFSDLKVIDDFAFFRCGKLKDFDYNPKQTKLINDPFSLCPFGSEKTNK